MEIPAIYENGVVRPLAPLTLPESTPVSIVVPSMPAQGESQSKSPPMELYRLLDQRFNSGQHDIAAHHNEHQP
jgi:predicted DNA-binding antitoxin AbrB/MazE fold protein